MLSMHDIRGVCAMPVTPSQPNVTAWDEDNTVELDVSAKMAKDLVDAGVGSFALCGTTGEGWALSLDEKKSFVDTVLQVVGHRVPVFAGATQLGTKVTINEMRAFRDLGAEGAFVGLATVADAHHGELGPLPGRSERGSAGHAHHAVCQ